MKRAILAALAAWAAMTMSGAAAAEELVVGFQQGGSSVLLMLGKEEKFFNDDATKFIHFLSSADGLNALNSGKIDVGASFGTCAPLTFATKGAPFVIIAGNLAGGHPIVTKPENAERLKDITGFKGMKVGTPRLFTSDVVWRGALFKAGLKPGVDVEIVEFKRPVDVLEAVKSGKIDAGVGSSAITVQARAAGLAIPLFTNDLFPEHPCCRIVTTRAVLKNKRPELVQLVKGLILAEKKFREDPESAVRANIRQQKFTEELARELSLEPHQIYNADPNTQGVLKMWEYMLACDYLQSDLNPRDLIDTSLYLDALTELRREQPAAEKYWAEIAARYQEWNEG
ncbi:MAG: ABC transporter substrate-binding protein [Planctomycetota bacterium]|jgi:NitT/TauT family transport system substrate-binding protein|nr:ABC transporter substrate-binding protein [Planctomycetota bacterium]